uniref:HAT C-terminal dimerisation domain-containing protein n=1 Tax=Nelumbo nucifera TaxID=4432 RepID=A0A822XSD4_NELNU|nr:TPA_asm: hypothetical protein HUJ06_021851 [Nelumbo nucifera]
MMMSRFKEYKSVSGGGDAKSELDIYLNEDTEKGQGNDDFDILGWWKVNNNPKFPILLQMARDVLAIPISTIAFESTFSTEGRVLDAFRSSLALKVAKPLICTRDWTRSLQHAINVEDLEEIDRFENGNTLFYLSFIYQF